MLGHVMTLFFGFVCKICNYFERACEDSQARLKAVASLAVRSKESLKVLANGSVFFSCKNRRSLKKPLDQNRVQETIEKM